MKILILPSWYPNEKNPVNGIFFKEQAIALKKNGHDVIVAAYPEFISLKSIGNRSNKIGLFFSNEEGLPTYRIANYNYFPRNRRMNFILARKRINKIIRIIFEKHGIPDLIHAHSCLWGGYFASEISKKWSIPLVITEHSTAFSRGLIDQFEEEYIKKALNIASSVIAVGPGLKKELTKYIVDSKISIIPNIVNTDDFKYIDKRLDYDGFRFFSLGLLTHKKGMDTLIKSFSKINNTNSKLIIGGDGEEKNKLLELVKDLSLSDRVIFTGQLTREEVKREMQSCNAFVLASRHETFGVVFIEALASGKPIIATKTGGPDDIINDKNGVLVPVDDIASLTKAMDSMINDYQKYDSIQIRNNCIERFSEEAVVKQINKIYDYIK